MDMSHPGLAYHKCGTVARWRRSRRIADRRVLAATRRQVFERDHHECRAMGLGECFGPLTLAHMEGKRRHQTRGLPADERHDPAWCLALCLRHHELEERHQVRVVYRTAEQCNGPVRFVRSAA